MLSMPNAGDPRHASDAASSKQRFTSNDLERMEGGFYLRGQRPIVSHGCPCRRASMSDTGTGEASHSRAGVERLKADNPDLLMVDFAMPGMNGLEVIAEVKRTHPQLRVILATGYADVDGSKDRVDGYAVLTKPFQIGDLARTVKAALMRSHA
jgi:CheY-like chemotaxis protein